jgi:hypothetical protein
VLVGGTGVFVGGTGVLVGGTGVLVGGTGVLVGGTGVFVGGTGVSVAGTGVLVGGTGVSVGAIGVFTPGADVAGRTRVGSPSSGVAVNVGVGDAGSVLGVGDLGVLLGRGVEVGGAGGLGGRRGTQSVAPAKIRSPCRQLAFWSAATVEPTRRAMLERVSPFCIT